MATFSCLVLPSVYREPPPLWWPAKLPEDTVFQTFDTATLPAPINPGEIAALSVKIAPSGGGEMQAAAIYLEGSIITVKETGGVAGRVYTLLFSATLGDGTQPQWIISQCVNPMPPAGTIPPAPVPGFGMEINWMPILEYVTGLVAAGSTQATAAPIGARTSVFTTVTPQANSVILPFWYDHGPPLVIVNTTDIPMQAWPPEGAQINTLGVNQPAIIEPQGSASFGTSAPLAQWTGF